MVSLETLTPFQDKPIELGQFQLILPYESPYSMFFCEFEWLFGLDFSTFPFNRELDTISVSTDIRRYLRDRALVLVPTTDILKKAYDMLRYNKDCCREPSERMRFEDFGSGPWEYTILPRCWNRKTRLTKPLPPLYHRSADGTTIPVSFDDYDTLPRFTSHVHPLVVVLCHCLMTLDDRPLSKIQEKLVAPTNKFFAAWPHCDHNRFVPLPDQRFKNPIDNMRAENIVCRCCACYHEESTTSDGSDVESGYTSTDTSEEKVQDAEARVLEYKEVSRTTNERIAKWREYLGRMPFVCEDAKHDDMLDEYAQEPVEDAETVVLTHSKEEQRKREALAEGLHQELASRKRSRRSYF